MKPGTRTEAPFCIRQRADPDARAIVLQLASNDPKDTRDPYPIASVSIPVVEDDGGAKSPLLVGIQAVVLDWLTRQLEKSGAEVVGMREVPVPRKPAAPAFKVPARMEAIAQVAAMLAPGAAGPRRNRKGCTVEKLDEKNLPPDVYSAPVMISVKPDERGGIGFWIEPTQRSAETPPDTDVLVLTINRAVVEDDGRGASPLYVKVQDAVVDWLERVLQQQGFHVVGTSRLDTLPEACRAGTCAHPKRGEKWH